MFTFIAAVLFSFKYHPFLLFLQGHQSAYQLLPLDSGEIPNLLTKSLGKTWSFPPLKSHKIFLAVNPGAAGIDGLEVLCPTPPPKQPLHPPSSFKTDFKKSTTSDYLEETNGKRWIFENQVQQHHQG